MRGATLVCCLFMCVSLSVLVTEMHFMQVAPTQTPTLTGPCSDMTTGGRGDSNSLLTWSGAGSMSICWPAAAKAGSSWSVHVYSGQHCATRSTVMNISSTLVNSGVLLGCGPVCSHCGGEISSPGHVLWAVFDVEEPMFREIAILLVLRSRGLLWSNQSV